MQKIMVGVMALLVSFAAPLKAEEQKAEYTVVIKNHMFTPAKLEVPAGKPFTLVVDNQDPTPEEFESHDLKREKIVKGNSKIVVKLGALKAGEYKYFGEFNEKTAQGVIVAK